MNFEIPQQKPWENKKSTIFNKWLIEQIKLSPESWSPDFEAYVEMKGKESEEKKNPRKQLLRKKEKKHSSDI